MRRRRSSSASSGMSRWNGRISVPVSTVATRTSRSSVDHLIVVGRRIRRARRISSRTSLYGDAANDRRTTLSGCPMQVNDVHHISTDPGAHFRESSIPRDAYRGGTEAAMLLRWKNHEFEEAEREVARRWREELAAHEPERMIAIVRNILPTGTRISNLKCSRQRSTASARASCAKSSQSSYTCRGAGMSAEDGARTLGIDPTPVIFWLNPASPRVCGPRSLLRSQEGDPYHALLLATGGNPPQRSSRVSAVSSVSDLRPLATGCN